MKGFQKIKHCSFLLLVLLSSCASFIVTPASLEEQLKTNHASGKLTNGQKVSLIKYAANSLERIKCLDKKGNEVWLKVDANTQILFKKTDGTYFQAYFDSVTLRNDTIYSLESRISGGHQINLLKHIESVKIKSEFPKTEFVR
ncbi:MAG: hypothetical protein M3R27_14355 [Bacteroidota bacterium]|nr:hypothetical protein [Bacteroidota bacterium]